MLCPKARFSAKVCPSLPIRPMPELSPPPPDPQNPGPEGPAPELVPAASPEAASPFPAPPEGPPVRKAEAPPSERRPTFLFFGVVAAVSLAADVLSKAWAEIVLSSRTMLDPSIVLVKNHLAFTLAYNKGGAWGLLQDAPEA